MVKKGGPLDPTKYGSDKPNYTKTTRHVEIILEEDEFLELVGDAKKKRQNPNGNWRDAYAGIQSEEVYYHKDEINKVLVEEIRHIKRYDVLGNKVDVNDIDGKSWTGQFISGGQKGSCIDPFGHHGPRTVFLGYDGFETGIVDESNGKVNVLCTECLEHQGRRLNLAKWIGLGGLLWKPEEL